MSDAICWNCGKPLPELPVPVSRHEYCPHCAEPVHCCRMCVRYAPRLPDQCREDQADPPTDKSSANFCDFFLLKASNDPAVEADPDERARARLEVLFGAADEADAGEPAPGGTADHDERAAAARSKLDALFGDAPPGADGK